MTSARWVIAATAAASLAATAGCGHGGESKAQAGPAAPRPVAVTVADLAVRPVERTVEAVGTLKGWEEVTIGSKRTGRVARVGRDMGDRVRPGELIVLLETDDAELAVAQAERRLQADLAKLGLAEPPKGEFDVTKVPAVVQAQVAEDRAQRNYDYERGVNSRGFGTKQVLQNAQNDWDSARAAHENAVLQARAVLAEAMASKAALDVARKARADMEIRAPVPQNLPDGGDASGLSYALARRAVSEGQMVREGDAIADLVLEKPLRLWVTVPERFSAEVKLDQPVRLTVAARPGETFAGRVARINPAVDPVSRTFQVEALVPNEDGRLRPGGFASASIVTDSASEARVVPLESVVRFAGVTKIFLADGDRAREVPVETGLEGPGWIEVRPVRTGALPTRAARVVTSGQSQLADGALIVIKAPESESPASSSAAETPAAAGSEPGPKPSLPAGTASADRPSD